jgi:hypothetical protein
MRVWTVGHSTHTLDRFVALLTAHGIALVADIRAVPRSRFHPWFIRTRSPRGWHNSASWRQRSPPPRCARRRCVGAAIDGWSPIASSQSGYVRHTGSDGHVSSHRLASFATGRRRRTDHVIRAPPNWVPRMSGRMLSESRGRWSFWLFLIGFHVTFLIHHSAALSGMPRRVYDYTDTGHLALYNRIPSLGSLILAVGVLLSVLNLLRSLEKARSRDPIRERPTRSSGSCPPRHRRTTST